MAPACAWCFHEICDVAVEWNGGVGHEACVAEVERIVLPDAPGPCVPRRRFYRDRRTILDHVELEGLKLGLDGRKLSEAIRRARACVA
jgi:hypothetical protein